MPQNLLCIFYVLRFIGGGGVVKVCDVASSSHLAPRRHELYLLHWMHLYTQLRQMYTMTTCLKFTCTHLVTMLCTFKVTMVVHLPSMHVWNFYGKLLATLDFMCTAPGRS